MRTFQTLYLFYFLAFYAILTFSTIIGFSRISGPGSKKKFRNIIPIYSLLMVIVFIYLYVWPNNARNSNNYSIYLIYNSLLSIDFIFKIPLTLSIIVGLVFYRKKKPTIYIIGLISSICLSISVLYGTLIGKNELTVNRVELEFKNLPQSFDGYKIVQLSDIHLGSFIHSKKLMNKVKKQVDLINPSLVLFTGDLVNNFSDEINGWAEIFEGISINRNSYSILGNHDYGNYSNWDSKENKEENFEKIITAHKTFGFKLLRNEHVSLVYAKDSIFLIGVENWGHPPFPQYANLEKAVSDIPANAFKILMTHDPAHWESVVKQRQDIDLSLSGHTHGLQLGIKKAGILFSISYFVRKNWAGLYTYGKSKLYVNTGLGMVGIPWRINMPGELTVITLKRIEVD